MNKSDIAKTIEMQRSFFMTHKTKDIQFRLVALRKLRKAIWEYEHKIYQALYADLKKSKNESYGTEIGIVLSEISMHIRNLKKWTRPQRKKTSLINFISKGYVYPEPYGVVMILGAWNYPLQLILNPLTGAIAAGNCAALKTSEYAPYTAVVIEEMLSKYFAKEYISIFHGGIEISQTLLQEKFDYIFFTGNPGVGRVIMQAAAKHLTPVTLELGGKSPAIVDKDADIDLAARRIIWGKGLNAGQTCIAPDYVMAQKDIKPALLEAMKKYLIQFWGGDPKNNEEYPRIINERHFDRLCGLIKSSTIYFGGESDRNQKYIAPTLLDNVSEQDLIMQEEIFGPVLPVMEFVELDEVFHFLNRRPKPLALYYFSNDQKKSKEIIAKTSAGGVCINDTMGHTANLDMPFGGVGESGMGAYHGKYTFDVFTHYKSVMIRSNIIDLWLKYAPYKGEIKLAIVKRILK